MATDWSSIYVGRKVQIVLYRKEVWQKMALDNAKSSERSKTWTPEPAPLESQAEKLIRKSKKDPFIPIGEFGLGL